MQDGQKPRQHWRIPMTDSSTGGYLAPNNTVLEDQQLENFLHNVFVGITGLDNTLVRPAYQEESPTIPAINVDWMAFNLTNRNPLNASTIQMSEDGETASSYREELIDVVCSFYGPMCHYNALNLSQGLWVSQNRDVLKTQGINLYSTNDAIFAPELINNRYYRRCDVTITLTRGVEIDYNILSLQDLSGGIEADDNSGNVITATIPSIL